MKLSATHLRKDCNSAYISNVHKQYSHKYNQNSLKSEKNTRTARTNYWPVVPWSSFNVMSFVEPANDASKPGIHSYFRGSRGTGRSRSRRGNVVARRSLITNYCCSLRRRFELEPSGRLHLNETRSHCRVASISFFKYHSGSTVLCYCTRVAMLSGCTMRCRRAQKR